MRLRRAAWGAALIGGMLSVMMAGAASPTGDRFTAAERKYWAFQKVVRPQVPKIDSAANPIDAFLLAELEEKGLSFGLPADRVSLIRRAYFDLIGAPPTPEEVRAFVEDKSRDAFARVVDHLLESPHYGERWGRHWLDLARYAESEGFKSDETRPNAWRYRDYVIQAFNKDKPYDRFVMEQIAGDELWPNDTEARVATAFNRQFPDETNAAVIMQRRQEILQDITDVVGSTFMGLTFGCAKCHDHKFDSILQADYYRLQAFFANTAPDDHIVLSRADEIVNYQQRLAEWEEQTRDVRRQISEIIEPKREEMIHERFIRYPAELQAYFSKPKEEQTPYERQMYNTYLWQMKYVTSDDDVVDTLKGETKERYEELKAQLDQYDGLRPDELAIGVGMHDLGREAPPTRILSLANWQAPQEEVQPGFLTILDPGPAKYSQPEGFESSGRRTALAKWLVNPENPLTSRVMVNRIWYYHFGGGIVATPSDFGNMGERPTHPELLDWLADEFVHSGWSLKRMHRLIMTSQAYQQGSQFREAPAKVDPANKLLWRFPPQRLEAEVIRDSALKVSGVLNEQIGGPSVFPPLPEGMPERPNVWQVSENPNDQYRRSVYVFVRRNARYPMLEVMDMPDTHESCAYREVTTTAPQALMLLNSKQTIDWSRAFASRVLSMAGSNRTAQVEAAFQLAYSRSPDGWEKDAALTFFDRDHKIISDRAQAGEELALPAAMPEGFDIAEGAALVDFCHTILNSNEFVYQF